MTGQLTGLSTATAAEFSFLLGLPTLGAATLYEAYKSREALAGVGALNVAIGLVVSFVVAWGGHRRVHRLSQEAGARALRRCTEILLGVLVFVVLVRS